MRYTGPDKHTRKIVQRRTAGLCMRCYAPASQIHHRKPRGSGGTSDPTINDPQNLILVCVRCHQDIESRRSEAFTYGWLVKRSDNPADVPVIDISGRELWLDNTGAALPKGHL